MRTDNESDGWHVLRNREDVENYMAGLARRLDRNHRQDAEREHALDRWADDGGAL